MPDDDQLTVTADVAPNEMEHFALHDRAMAMAAADQLTDILASAFERSVGGRDPEEMSDELIGEMATEFSALVFNATAQVVADTVGRIVDRCSGELPVETDYVTGVVKVAWEQSGE